MKEIDNSGLKYLLLGKVILKKLKQLVLKPKN